MNKREKAAFVIYLVCGVIALVFGILYLRCTTIMPYHQTAIGIPWEQLGSGVQTLLQGLVKIASAGLFVTGISFLVLLLIPFRHGEPWAKWAIPAIGLVWNSFTLYVTVKVAIETPALTPWPASMVVMGLLLAGFMLAPGWGRVVRR